MTALITRYGVLGVFALMVPESACVPVPSEVTLLFSGFAVHEGWMSLPLAVIAATAGNLVGSLIAYGVGATQLLRRVPLVRSALRSSDGLFDRHGNRAVLIARLLPLARTFVSLPAGARRVPLVPFVALTVTGCAIWAIAFVLVGLLLGASWSSVDTVLGRVLLGLGVGLAAIAAQRHARARHRSDDDSGRRHDR